MIRAYLLKGIINSDRAERIQARLRGPKDEFKDFASFLIVHARTGDIDFQILVESGVYENLRIVATDSKIIAEWSSEDVIRTFTNALEKPELNNTTLILSHDSRIH